MREFIIKNIGNIEIASWVALAMVAALVAFAPPGWSQVRHSPIPQDTTQMNKDLDFYLNIHVCYADETCVGPAKSVRMDTIEQCQHLASELGALLIADQETKGPITKGEMVCEGVLAGIDVGAG